MKDDMEVRGEHWNSWFSNSVRNLRAEWHLARVWASGCCCLIEALWAGWHGDEGWTLKQWIQQVCKKPSCRMTWGWAKSGRRIRFIEVCRDGLDTKIPSCLMLKTWINPKTIGTASKADQYKEHRLKTKLRVSIKNQYTQHHSKNQYSEHHSLKNIQNINPKPIYTSINNQKDQTHSKANSHTHL